MRYPNPSVPLRVGALAVLAALSCGAVCADTPGADSGGVTAVWTPKQLHFVFLGFTAKFSCDGLADRVRSVLLLLGARKDLQVNPSSCSTPFGRPDPFPGVTIKMNVLEPEGGSAGQNAGNSAANTAGSGGQAPESVPAHWKLVDVNSALARDPLWQAGQCELLEQIKQSILPQFSARNVQYSSTCVPNQLTLGATQLKAEVLMPDQPNAAAPAATAPAATAPATTAPGPAALYLYPRNNQSAAQMQSDREACHGWAVSQSGYDPTRPAPQATGNPAEYRRVMIACLDARGYTAR
jgi:hypothetical protein